MIEIGFGAPAGIAGGFMDIASGIAGLAQGREVDWEKEAGRGVASAVGGDPEKAELAIEAVTTIASIYNISKLPSSAGKLIDSAKGLDGLSKTAKATDSLKDAFKATEAEGGLVKSAPLFFFGGGRPLQRLGLCEMRVALATVLKGLSISWKRGSTLSVNLKGVVMPVMRLLPLGTVFKPKGLKPGWESMRLMVTGYYPIERNGSRCNDYIVTPWPLGFVNYEDGSQESFYCRDEADIEQIEFLGAIDDYCKEKTDELYNEVLGSSRTRCPLSQGAEPMMRAYGDLPCTIRDIPFSQDEILPLGTVISTESNGAQKAMIYQQSGTANGKRYDYGICAWPEGADPGSGNIYVIRQREITAVHFRGYENALSQERAKQLEKQRRGSLFSRIFGKASEW